MVTDFGGRQRGAGRRGRSRGRRRGRGRGRGSTRTGVGRSRTRASRARGRGRVADATRDAAGATVADRSDAARLATRPTPPPRRGASGERDRRGSRSSAARLMPLHHRPGVGDDVARRLEHLLVRPRGPQTDDVAARQPGCRASTRARGAHGLRHALVRARAPATCSTYVRPHASFGSTMSAALSAIPAARLHPASARARVPLAYAALGAAQLAQRRADPLLRRVAAGASRSDRA